MFSRGYRRAWKTKRLALYCRIFFHIDTPDPRTELLFYVDFETFLQPKSHGDHESELSGRAERYAETRLGQTLIFPSHGETSDSEA
jgi:hypothetical protein